MTHFLSLQKTFADHIRNPAGSPPPPGIEERRLRIYRDLFYNNVESFLAQGFPVMKSLLDNRGLWHPLVRVFFSAHRCDSPYFVDIPAAFLGYLTSGTLAPEYPPYIAELGHYEWLELDVDICRAEIPAAIDFNGDLLNRPVMLNPTLRLACYQWPVTTISRDCEPEQPLAEPLSLALFRDRSEKVCFLQVNSAVFTLLTLLQESEGITGQQALKRLAQALPHINEEQLLHFGRETLDELRRKGLIPGSRPISVNRP